MDLDHLCGRLLGLMPPSQRYKVRLCRIGTQEFPVFCGGFIRSQAGNVLLDGGLIHNRGTDLDALCGRLLGLTPAFQRYKVRLCRIKAQEIAVFCGADPYRSPGDILLDGKLLSDRWTDSVPLCPRLLAMQQASQ